MKRLITALVLSACAFTAQAEPLWLAAVNNNAGGSIILTLRNDRPSCNGEMAVISTMGKKPIGFGCYVIQHGEVIIAWDSGNVKKYKLSNFTPNPEISGTASTKDDYRSDM